MKSYAYNPDTLRRAPGERPSFTKTMLLILSVVSGIMLGLAIPNLVGGDGTIIVVKSLLLASGGTAVAYAVNRLAVERGAPLATVGYKAAGIVSVVSIGIVGGGLFSATYAGLTFNDVEQLRIEAYGEALSDYASRASTVATQASRVIPGVSAIVSDLEQKYACEIAESCLSGHAGGGNGPVARVLLEKLGRAQTLAEQVQNGKVERDQALETIAALYGDYQFTAGSDEFSAEEKRRALLGIDLKIKQAASRLEEAVPVALLVAYADELKAGAQIEGHPEVSTKVSGILYQHGQALAELVASIPDQDREAPAFPKATGVSDTFNYIGHFLPVAAIAAVVELVFPISLWLYTVFALSWANYRVSPPLPRKPDADDTAFDELLSGPMARRDQPEPSRTNPSHSATGGSVP